jgi:hypothetical protein
MTAFMLSAAVIVAIIAGWSCALRWSSFSIWATAYRAWPRLLPAAVVVFLVTMSLQPVQSASAQPSDAPIPRLVVHARGIAGEPLPLGLTIEGGADGAVVIVTGLVPGMTLSTGIALGANVWQVPATDLANTWVGPPMDFVGVVDLIAELQLADATVINHQPIQME